MASNRTRTLLERGKQHLYWQSTTTHVFTLLLTSILHMIVNFNLTPESSIHNDMWYRANGSHTELVPTYKDTPSRSLVPFWLSGSVRTWNT
eukprot:jgi/Botrbrau1/10255/Bobra.0140s0011.1